MSDYSIEVNKVIHDVITKMKNNLSLQIGDKATYKLVIQVLLKEHYSIPHLKQEITDLKIELEQKEKEHADFMKKLLLQKSNTPVMAMPMNMSSTNTAPAFAPPPPPPKIPLKTPTIDLSKIKSSADLKKQYKNEIKQVFDGTIRKPSEILNASKPKHLKAEITEYDGDGIDLIEKSTVLSKPDFFKRTEKTVQYIN